MDQALIAHRHVLRFSVVLTGGSGELLLGVTRDAGVPHSDEVMR